MSRLDRLKIQSCAAAFIRHAARQSVGYTMAPHRMLGPVTAPGLRGEIQMPTKVNLELIMVWFCVGFFTGAGWAVATWLVGRILGLTHL
jgi:hypothetical protein